MPCKVDYADLESVTKFLDTLSSTPTTLKESILRQTKAAKLSKMIKDKYTEIKPDYEKNS